jgi:hypothetical protein
MIKNKLNMKTIRFFILSLLILVGFVSCDKKLDDTGEPYFNFKDATEQTNPTGYNVGFAGNTSGQKYIIRSNKSWKITEQTENDWVRFFPNEGDADGIVKIIVQENKTFTNRSMQFAFVVDGEEQPVLFTVDQDAATPYLTLSDQGIKNISRGAQDVKITVTSNVQYTYTSTADWLTYKSTTIGQSSTELLFTATVNTSPNVRTGIINFSCAQFPNLNKTYTVNQEGSVLLYETFDWLNYGNTVTYTTTGETAYNSWTTDEKARGWTGTSCSDISGGTGIWIYARPGFVKLGKTSVGGDLISPKLSGISDSQKIIVSFKAICYVSESASATAGSYDFNELNIEILGGGTITEITNKGVDPAPIYNREPLLRTGCHPSSDSHLTSTGAQFWIGTYPSNKNGWPNPTGYNIWDVNYVTRSFVVTGATKDTQIRWIGGPTIGDLRPDGSTAYTNRIFLDDIKVELSTN